MQLGAKTRHMKEVLTTVFAVEMTHAKFGLYYVLDFKQAGEVSKEVVSEVDELFDPNNKLGVQVLKAAARYPNNVKIIPRTEQK